MNLGEHITQLRKRKKISQNDLGKKIGTSGDIIGRYERNEVKPSIEVASKIADVLNVSLDFLMCKVDVEIDNELLNRVLEIQKMNDEDKKHIFVFLFWTLLLGRPAAPNTPRARFWQVQKIKNNNSNIKK